jgi:hypothetical protein
MSTNPTRAVEATRTPEFDHPSAAWSLADDIADRIAAACPDELDGIVKDMWCDHTNGRLTETEMEALDEAARARREAIQTRRTETRPKPRTAPSSASRASARRPQRSPDRQASIERRRRIVASGPLPPQIACQYTWSEQAALAIIGNEVRRQGGRGVCMLYVEAMAAMAGVCRTTVQNALRKASDKSEGRAIIEVDHRRRTRNRNLSNVIKIISPEWLTWLRRARPAAFQLALGVGSKNKKMSTTDTVVSKKGSADGTPWGVPDGVCSYEEVG